MELHPAGFIETGTCDGPRYVREQPSRSSPVPGSGVGSGPNPDYYLTENTLVLPYKNLLEYTKEIEQQWGMLDQPQKDIISNSLSLFIMKNPEAVVGLNSFIQSNDEEKKELINRLESVNKKESFANETTVSDIISYLNVDPNSRLPDVLNEINDMSIKNKESNINHKEIKTSFENWLNNNSYKKITNDKYVILIIIFIVVFLIGIMVGYKN